ncbi:hypothetical protein SAMN05421858_3062 [Haladaptatus litoreus]|uniref:Uncharacterized protein n=1 Tax=Haladaptatus litoreus TaxID=553468 RepID=A0A1N7CK57_9EURY|nr:hypothetical protein SAMN05421858_3062 [Haladaptatus litoreus]
MMLRLLLSTIGFTELLLPNTLIDRAEQLALDNPDDCELQSWIIPGARIEGLLIVISMWRSDRSYAAFKREDCSVHCHSRSWFVRVFDCFFALTATRVVEQSWNHFEKM